MFGMSTTSDEARAVGQVMERMRARFPDMEPEMIRSVVEQVHHQYDGRPIREFVPVLVEREVVDALRLVPQRRSSEEHAPVEKELLATP